MIILQPNKTTGGLRLKKGFLTREEVAYVKADYLQNCALPRNMAELGIESENYGEKLQIAQELIAL